MKSFKLFLEERQGKIVQAEESPLYKNRSAPEGKLHSDDEVQKALNTDTTSKRIMAKGIKKKNGDLTGVRLNINVLNNTGVPVLTMHKPTNKSGYRQGRGFYGGEAQQYGHVVTLRNAHFNVHQKGREAIATGTQNKFPMASVDGEYHDASHNFNGVVAGFNPKRHHLFVDEKGRAIRSAEEVTLHGHRAYLRGKIEYHTPETAPKRKGDAPSQVSMHESFFVESTYDIYFKEDTTYTPEGGTQMGSNEGGIHTDKNGKKYYIKYYNNGDQAKSEALTGQIYHHMGIHTLQPKHEMINGRHAIVTKYNPDLKSMKPREFNDTTPEQAHHIGKMYHAATLTKNWDIVGLEHDNIMKHKNGDLHAIDHGGSFEFRARGGHKDYGPDIGEHQSLRDNNQASGHVFKSVFAQHPEAEKKGLDSVRKMDDTHVHSLFKNSGLSNWQDLHKNFMERKKKLLDTYKE